MDKYIYRPGIDNIFGFYFMDDFTTVAVIKEGETDTSNLEYENDDDFYCFSEKKSYLAEELFKKFNIEVREHTDELK